MLAILGGLMMGMFLAALDQTIVATAIRTIGDDLNGLTLQAWVTTAYLITSTLSTPLYGKLSDIYGRKPFYLVSIGLFLAGSLLSGTATSMYQLAGYRALQGLGGGGLMSLAITILGDLLSPRERARYQAMFLAVFGVSSVVGPIVGGFFADATTVFGITGWRWIFLVNVPLGIAGMIVIARVLHLPKHHVDHRIDWQGAVALAGGLVPLLVIAEQGRDWGWASGAAFGCYGLGALGIALFIWAERAAKDEALLPLRLFRNSTFSTTAMVNVVLGMGMFGGIATLPLWLQIVKGMTPTDAGLALLPFTGGIMVSSVIAGQTVGHTGRYKIFPVLGTGALVAGAYLLAQLEPASSYGDVAWRAAVFGFGLGFCFQPLVLAVQNAVPPRDMGTATSSSLFFRQMGGTLGTAVFLSILFSTVGGRIKDAFATAAQDPSFQAVLQDKAVLNNPANAPVLQALQNPGSSTVSLNDSSFLSQINPKLAAPIIQGFSDSVSVVMLTAAVVLLLGFLLTWFVPELPLRMTSGIQSRMEEDAAAAAQASAYGSGVPEEAGAAGAAAADSVPDAPSDALREPGAVPDDDQPHGRHAAD
ncbi:MDR family MFS transporter [Isoptericola sp. b441]|uniref:MDR family MFS transporter n=1 Tax=Actinotalea lenta TaxID=3064654 RepID=A0ABT9D613_9CELL|nr:MULTISPECIES: MDR family MFS transporter [unclassified Isoptericola]MDO8106250.1 MDR family MFS transporter [Isoptericola sp. b441]MDO8122030.1 MDR family MFS transporter [Isoptericola sp. b490]